MAGLNAACGQIRPTAPIAAPLTATPVAPAAVRNGASLLISQNAAVPSTDPFPSGPALTTFKWAMFNPLVSLDAHNQPVPSLAESWSLSENAQRLTLKLRQGVVFHSGRPFTAESAQRNIEHAKDPKSQSAASGELSGVQTKIIDPRTLELDLTDVYPAHLLTVDDHHDRRSSLGHRLGAAGTGAFQL